MTTTLDSLRSVDDTGAHNEWVLHPSCVGVPGQRALALFASAPPGWYLLTELKAAAAGACGVSESWAENLLRHGERIGLFERQTRWVGRERRRAYFHLDPERFRTIWPEWKPEEYGVLPLGLQPVELRAEARRGVAR